ncbi:TraB/GumN family protein [Chitinophagaceae bacterium LWZ2-11]
MRLFRTMLSCILLVICPTCIFAQKQYANTLLWRISGKGLEKPSYLFGTMHLNDKRLFRFDDSVYSAIEHSEGFAIEVNPDEMIAYSVNKMVDNLGKGKNIKDVLTSKDYRKYSDKLTKKFKKPANEINTNDLVKEKNKWMTEYLEKGEMPTFVDAYLFNVARREGKWTGGIEDIADQAGLLEENIDKTDIEYMLADDKEVSENKVMEKMINMYEMQNITDIEAFAGSSFGDKDVTLIKRNVKMARRMDSLIAFRNMFFAIGSAHLAGDSGVINMLRSRGFTVEPVISNKKIASDDYKVKEVEQPWYEVSDANGLYKVSMPGNATVVKLYGLLEMKFLMDIFTYTGFSSMAVVSGEKQGAEKDKMFDVMAEQIFSKPKLPWKKIENNGIEGREYLQPLDGTYSRLQLFFFNKTVYMAHMFALKKEELSSDKASKFFSSYTITKVKPASETNTYEFKDSIFGISLKSHVKLELNEKMSKMNDGSTGMSVYSGVEVSSGSYIMLFVNNIKPGYHIINARDNYDNFYSLFEKQYFNVKKDSFLLDGAKVFVAVGEVKAQHGLYVKSIASVKNNRAFILMVLTDSANKPMADEVIASFKFIPHPIVNWKRSMSIDSTFTTWGPSNIMPYITEGGESQQLGYDTTTASTYYVIPGNLNKYTWFDSVGSFWNAQIKAETGYRDSLLSDVLVKNGSVEGREILVQKKGGITYNRTRFLVNDTMLYKLYLSGEKDFLYSDNANKFFNEFSFNKPIRNTFITDSKAALLLSALESSDSVTRNDAYSALQIVPFAKKDLPLLHAALFKQYLPINFYVDTTMINEAIAKQLIRVNDTSTIAFVKQQYHQFINEREPLKIVALALLANVHTKESYDLLAHLLITSPPEKDALSYKIRAGLNDSLALTASIYSSLAKLASDSTSGPALAKISLTLIDSSALDKSVVKTYEGDFITAANTLLPSLKKKTDDFYNYEIRDLIKLLLVLNSPASVKTVKDYLQVYDKDLREYVAARLLEKGIPVQPEIITGIAADKVSRQNLYYDLKKMNRSSLFPKQYLTQAYFAESQMYLMASDEDDPTSITFLSKKEGLYNEKKYLFYLYKVTYGKGKDATSYLGVAGGYNLSGTGIEEKEELTQVFTDEEFDANKIAQLFNKYLKSLAKSDDETED